MYDAIVVGARCAGASAAMLLARAGHRVLVVDRVPPSSGHVPPAGSVVAPGVVLLDRWGLIDDLRATGCPPVRHVRVHLGEATIDVPLGVPGAMDAIYVAERAALDPLLCDAARSAGAEMRIGVRVTSLQWEGGRVVGVVGTAADGSVVRERARVVIGADGKHSFVARAVDAGRYRVRPVGQCAYHAFWTGARRQEFEVFVTDGRECLVFPMSGGVSWVVALRPAGEWQEFRAEPERGYAQQISAFPDLAENLTGARRVSRLWGNADFDGFFRPAAGPGWVLLGDAGHTKDPGRGRGISDALLQAELMAGALDGFLSGQSTWEDAVGAAALTRDQLFGDVYELTHDLADTITVEGAGALLRRLQEAENQQLSWLLDRLPPSEATTIGGRHATSNG